MYTYDGNFLFISHNLILTKLSLSSNGYFITSSAKSVNSFMKDGVDKYEYT